VAKDMGHILNSGDDTPPAATQKSLRCGQRYGPHKISTFDFTNNAINKEIPGIGVIKKNSNRKMSYLGVRFSAYAFSFKFSR
jgi:hypothetical protein